MVDAEARVEVPPPGGVAWLEVSADTAAAWPGRTRTGPLGLQISPLPGARTPYYFKGARLRGARCVWSASTVSGAELQRRGRTLPAVPDAGVHLLARVECPGSVFDPVGHGGRGVLQVHDPADDIRETFLVNTHVYTLNVGRGTLGVEPGTFAELVGQTFDLTPLQSQLLRSSVGLLQSGGDELTTTSSLVGVDRYLGALAGLLLRTAVRRPATDVEQMESIRNRCDTIIFEQAADPMLSPAHIAAQLDISLRQLYRAFHGNESPAARIRRRRLEQAAELLATRSAPSQVERIAQDCGFLSAEYFSRAFRREFGLSPRAYRSAHRDRAGTSPPAQADAHRGQR